MAFLQKIHRDACCAVCGRPRSGKKVEHTPSIVTRGAFSVSHGDCDACRVSTLAFFSEKHGQVVGAGIATDLTDAELPMLFRRLPITSDDVLRAHRFLSH